MNRGDRAGSGARGPLLTFGSGGWVILGAVLLVALALGWRVGPLIRGATGGGSGPARQGFELDEALVPQDAIVEAGIPRDGLPVLTEPEVMSASAVAAVNEAHRGKFLVPSDRVVGVAWDGGARAYPLRVLNWHEIVNDVVGGVPIAVVFNPLCDSVTVFDRRVGGRVVEFGFSGLLYNSNLLLYDRGDPGATPSLWSPLQGRAVAGPEARAKRVLRRLPASLASWRHWTGKHPETTVLRPDPERLERYRRDPYGSYLAGGRPRFPVSPMPEGPVPPMTPVVAIEREVGDEVFVLDPERVDTKALTRALAARGLEAVQLDRGFSVVAARNDSPATAFARWFAWYAQHPDARPTEPGSGSDREPPAAALARAEAAADALGKRLMGTLMRELHAGGPVAAIAVCAGAAQTIAAEQSTDGVRVRRVSLRPRNPADEPDAHEREVLVGWEETGGPVETSVVVADHDGRRVLRYLRPIRIAEPCLACHGPRERLDPGVASAVAERYPEDRAVDYGVGDLRGAISVEVTLE